MTNVTQLVSAAEKCERRMCGLWDIYVRLQLKPPMDAFVIKPKIKTKREESTSLQGSAHTQAVIFQYLHVLKGGWLRVYRQWVSKCTCTNCSLCCLEDDHITRFFTAVFKQEPYDTMFYLKLGLYHWGWKLVSLEQFHIAQCHHMFPTLVFLKRLPTA